MIGLICRKKSVETRVAFLSGSEEMLDIIVIYDEKCILFVYDPTITVSKKSNG